MKRKSLLLTIIFLAVTLGAGKEVILADVETPIEGFLTCPWDSDSQFVEAIISTSSVGDDYEISDLDDSGYDRTTAIWSASPLTYDEGFTTDEITFFFDDDELKSGLLSFVTDEYNSDFSGDELRMYWTSLYGEPQLTFKDEGNGSGDIVIWIDPENSSFIMFTDNGYNATILYSVFESEVNSYYLTNVEENTGIENLLDQIKNNSGNSEIGYSFDPRDDLIGTWDYYTTNYTGHKAITILQRTFSTIVFYNDGTFSLGGTDGNWRVVHDGTAIEFDDNNGPTRVYNFLGDDQVLSIETDISSDAYANFYKRE